jgi:hypothetical protein
MSTRSCLAIRQPDGHYDAIYCHSDGYLPYNGVYLMKYYHGFNGARHLFRHGDMSSLGEVIGVKHDFEWRFNIKRNFRAEFDALSLEEKGQYLDTDGKPSRVIYELAQISAMPESRMCRFYGRDRGDYERMMGSYASFADLWDAYNETWCEYLYLFAGGTWWTDAGACRESMAEGQVPRLHLLMVALERDKARAEADPEDTWSRAHYANWDRSQVGPEPYLPRRATRLGYGHDDPPVALHPVATKQPKAPSGSATSYTKRRVVRL